MAIARSMQQDRGLIFSHAARTNEVSMFFIIWHKIYNFFLAVFSVSIPARKVRSVVLRLIKTDLNLCRILFVRLLDIRTPYRMFFVAHFLFFDFVVIVISFCCLFRIFPLLGHCDWLLTRPGRVSSQSQCFVSPEVTLAMY